jgi:hypothetical protein
MSTTLTALGTLLVLLCLGLLWLSAVEVASRLWQRREAERLYRSIERLLRRPVDTGG